jgi:hypothetical protein
MSKKSRLFFEKLKPTKKRNNTKQEHNKNNKKKKEGLSSFPFVSRLFTCSGAALFILVINIKTEKIIAFKCGSIVRTYDDEKNRGNHRRSTTTTTASREFIKSVSSYPILQ